MRERRELEDQFGRTERDQLGRLLTVNPCTPGATCVDETFTTCAEDGLTASQENCSFPAKCFEPAEEFSGGCHISTTPIILVYYGNDLEPSFPPFMFEAGSPIRLKANQSLPSALGSRITGYRWERNSIEHGNEWDVLYISGEDDREVVFTLSVTDDADIISAAPAAVSITFE